MCCGLHRERRRPGGRVRHRDWSSFEQLSSILDVAEAGFSPFADAGFFVTGVDIDAASVEFERARSNGKTSFFVGDVRRLAFSNRSFDYAISVTPPFFVDAWPRAG